MTTALVHVLLVFLYVAPSNPISDRFDKQVRAWIDPFFRQGWGVFAPDPGGDNVQIFARTGWVTSSGERQVSDWFDISAVDRADTLHNPFPSRATELLLHSAWNDYVGSHDEDDVSATDTALRQAKFLRNIAVQRVAPFSPRPFQVIRLWVVTQPVGPSTEDAELEPDPADRRTRLLPWWNVTPDGN